MCFITTYSPGAIGIHQGNLIMGTFHWFCNTDWYFMDVVLFKHFLCPRKDDLLNAICRCTSTLLLYIYIEREIVSVSKPVPVLEPSPVAGNSCSFVPLIVVSFTNGNFFQRKTSCWQLCSKSSCKMLA